jgi:hypothetical protein
MRRAARTDDNLTDIVDTLRKAGCSVHITNGMWDLTIGYGGLVMLGEVKNPAQPPSKRRRTEAQKEWLQTWTGGCALILSPSDALEAANTLRRWAMMLRTMPQEQSGYESGAD